LLEVLVALSILGLSVAVLLQIFSTGMHAAALSEDYSYAALLAEGRLNEVLLEEELNTGVNSGAFDDKYDWEVRIDEYDLAVEEEDETDKPPLDVFRISVRVSWGEEPRVRSVQLQTLELRSQRGLR